MKKVYTVIIFLLGIGSSSFSQDIHFSQMYETPLYLSPANTGFYNGYVRAITNYKNQWAAMNNAFNTEGISIDGGLFRSKKRPAFMGAGLTYFTDRAGVAKLRKTYIQLNISGIVKLGSKSALSVGLSGGSASMNGNYNDLTYSSQFNGNYIDPNATSGENTGRQSTSTDVAAGIAYEFARYRRDADHDDVLRFRVSFGAYHLNQPVQDFWAGSNYRLPMRLCYALTSVYDITDTKFTVTPTFVFQQQGSYQEMVLGSYLKYRTGAGTKVTGVKTQDAIGFGMFYRVNESLIPKLIYDLGDYSIALAYDVNISSYTAASKGMGGFELALRYNYLASSLFESRKEYK